MSRTLLLVDAGNSRIKWALAAGAEWTMGLPLPVRGSSLASALDRIWPLIHRPDAVYVSNVAGPEVATTIDAWVGQHWAVPVCYARSEAGHGAVINGYVQPEQLGVDRWLGLLGLCQEAVLPACLVDCGTAITLDLLDREGRHRGGLIAPGLETMRRSLQASAHGLDLLEASPEAAVLGLDTASCIQAGCLTACAGLVEKSLARLTGSLNEPVRLVMTGGDAGRIGGQVSIPFQLDDAIVLRGLSVWAESHASLR